MSIYGYGCQNDSNKNNEVYTHLSTEDIKGFAIQSIPERRITLATAKAYGVRTGYCEKTGKKSSWFFPVTRNGKLAGWIRRAVHPSAKDQKWSVVGDVGISCDLVGTRRRGQKSNTSRLYITEGPWDMLTAYQVLMEGQSTPGKWIPAVVSIGFGTNNATNHIAHNQGKLDDYKEVVTCFDGDMVTADEKRVHPNMMKGREATQAVQLMLTNSGLYAKLDENMDLNDYLINNRERELYKILSWPAKWEHEALIEGCPVSFNDMCKPMQRGIPVKSFPVLQDKLQGFRPHEMTTLLAPPKTGKTSVSRQITLEFLECAARTGEKVFMAFMEDTKEKIAQSFAAIYADVKLYQYRQDPGLYGIEHIKKAKALLDASAIMLTTDNGHVSPDNLVKIIRHAISKGCTMFVIDHYSYILSGDRDGKQPERVKLDNMLTDLECLVKSHPIHIFGIAHITVDKAELAAARRRATPKDADEPDRPYWHRVDEYSGRGSGIFAQVSSNIIGIDKEIMPDRSRGKTQLSLLLCRETDNTGRCDMLTIHPGKGRFTLV